MLLDLNLKLGECFFAGGADVVANTGGMQRARGQGKIQRKRVLLVMRIFREPTVKLDQIGLITFQKPR